MRYTRALSEKKVNGQKCLSVMSLLKLKFPSELKNVKEVSTKVLDSLKDLKLDSLTLSDIRLSFEEAFINAVKYGNKGDNRLSIDVEIIKHRDAVEIIVRDQGNGFDYKHLEDPREEKNLTKTSGRGVFLIRNLMDEVTFEDNGRSLRMKKIIKRGGKDANNV